LRSPFNVASELSDALFVRLWSLTKLQQQFVKTGDRLGKPARCYRLPLAEIPTSRQAKGVVSHLPLPL